MLLSLGWFFGYFSGGSLGSLSSSRVTVFVVISFRGGGGCVGSVRGGVRFVCFAGAVRGGVYRVLCAYLVYF